jgi:hypothetical protein
MRNTISTLRMGLAAAMLVACGSGSPDQGSAPGVDENDLATASLENRAAAVANAPLPAPALGRTRQGKGHGRAHFGGSRRGHR